MDEIPKFFRHGGGWGNVSGPGQFMFRVFVSGGVSSVMMGMTGATLGALIWDTAAIPFIVSASIGYIIGAVGFYQDALRKALRALDRYPRLIQLHLDANFSHRGFDRYNLRQLRSETFGQSMVLRSMLICSWLTASPVIERIRTAQEDAMVDAAAEGRDIESEDNANSEEMKY